MEDKAQPFIGRNSIEATSMITTVLEDDYEDLNLPVTFGRCITFKYLPDQNKFKESESKDKIYEVLSGTSITFEEYTNNVQNSINNPKNLNKPSFWIRFFLTFLFIVIILTITVIIVMIWAMLILDLVFFAFGLYILKQSIKFFWIVRVALINKACFSHLRNELKRLNFRYNQYKLEWKLQMPEKWLQLGELNSQNNILGD